MHAETELKLLLPGAEPQRIAEQLARHPLLRRRPSEVQALHNVYYDTPAQDLRRQKVALRVRRLRSGSPPRDVWVQTLKTAGSSVGGLSQRGEWEAVLRNGQPRLTALRHSAWPALDPDGTLWPQLQPCFITTCTRTLWTVRQRDRSVIEVALDVGEILAGGRSLPICELELELKAGSPEALHALARALAADLALLPGQASKAERGYALARDEAELPRPGRPVALTREMPTRQAAAQLLAEAWDQTLRHTALLLHSDAPELLHQARVGWRRLRCLAWLFKPVVGPAPRDEALRAFWRRTDAVRELDVAQHHTLPAWANAYVGDDASRGWEWTAMTDALAAECEAARRAMRQQLAQPATGQAWLALGAWLNGLAADADDADDHRPAAPWPTIEQRLLRQHRRLRHAAIDGLSEAERHDLRLRAKRLRYGTEALAGVLPGGRARRWHHAALRLQAEEGARRDLVQAVDRLDRPDVPPGPRAFMWGVRAAVLSR